MGPVEFEAELWEYPGNAAWHFVTLPTDLADDVADHAPDGPGFGSVRVRVRVGATEWATSLFPDSRSASYLLPVKRPVRDAEGLAPGDRVAVSLRIADS